MKGDSSNVPPVLTGALAPALDGGACPHVAVLLRSEEEFTPIVASFYTLGVKRGGWLVHRSIEPERDPAAEARGGHQAQCDQSAALNHALRLCHSRPRATADLTALAGVG